MNSEESRKIFKIFKWLSDTVTFAWLACILRLILINQTSTEMTWDSWECEQTDQIKMHCFSNLKTQVLGTSG